MIFVFSEVSGFASCLGWPQECRKMKVESVSNGWIPALQRGCYVQLRDSQSGEIKKLTTQSCSPEGKIGYVDIQPGCNDTGRLFFRELDSLSFWPDEDCETPPARRRELSLKKIENLKIGDSISKLSFRERNSYQGVTHFHDFPGFTVDIESEYGKNYDRILKSPPKIREIYWSRHECEMWGGTATPYEINNQRTAWFYCALPENTKLKADL
jgi:hypothetical protein